MHFTQIRRRTLKIKTCVEDTNIKDEPMLLVVDAPGLTCQRKATTNKKSGDGIKRVHQITYISGWKNKENSLFQNNKKERVREAFER